MKLIVGLSLALAALPTHADAQDASTSKPAPELKAEKWYNTAPLSLDDLKGKAVLVQVFRTW